MYIIGQTVIHLLPLVIYQKELLTWDTFIKYYIPKSRTQ